jgi:hypothetical protein
VATEFIHAAAQNGTEEATAEHGLPLTQLQRALTDTAAAIAVAAPQLVKMQHNMPFRIVDVLEHWQA